jgi:hypothetical protein
MLFHYCHVNCLYSCSLQFLQNWVWRTGNNLSTWLAIQWTCNSNKPMHIHLYNWTAISTCLIRDCLQQCCYVASMVSSKVGGVWWGFLNSEGCVTVDLDQLWSDWHHCIVSNSSIQQQVLSKQFRSLYYILLLFVVISKL